MTCDLFQLETLNGSWQRVVLFSLDSIPLSFTFTRAYNVHGHDDTSHDSQ